MFWLWKVFETHLHIDYNVLEHFQTFLELNMIFGSF